MTPDIQDDDDAPISNPVQIVALNVVLSFALAVGGKISGMSWALSIGIAWIGGSVLTIAVLAILCWRHERRRAAGKGNDLSSSGAKLVPHNIKDPVQMWEVDRLFEEDHLILTRQKQSEKQSHEKAMRLWLEDAESDIAAENAAQSDKVIDDRRRNTLPFVGADRRARRG